MKLNITDKWAVLIEDDTLIQNSKKNYMAEFSFDESWEDFTKTALFEAGPASIVVVLEEDRCVIPPECLKRGGETLRIGVYGVKGDERKPTVWCRTSRILYSTNLSNGSSLPSTPIPDDLYAQIVAVIGDLSAAGFEGKTLVEVIQEIKDCECTTATDDEVDDMLNGTFGVKSDLPVPPSGECPDGTATDKEVSDILNDVFGAKSDLPVPPSEECTNGTATDKEVSDILNDVFGKTP